LTTVLSRWREEQLDDPRHSTRTAAILGIALGVCFTVCFLTGVLSHLIQHPPSWFTWSSRPAGLYRVTQGLHVASGIAAIPLLLAKLWSVFPRLFVWPPARDVAHLLERLSLLPLVGGSLFLLITGVANIDLWYPWPFFFPAGHYWVAWIVMGALVTHIGAKGTVARQALRRTATAPDAPSPDRRRFLGFVVSGSVLLTLATVGQTVGPLRRLALLAPRRPDRGIQGFPVNKTAVDANVTTSAVDPAYRLSIEGPGRVPVTLSLADLAVLPRRHATLPIACVEGWSASRTWTGVSLKDVLAHAGLTGVDEVEVISLEPRGLYSQSVVNHTQLADADTLLAMEVDGEPLALDHGYPIRLIGPNRSGVLQTKWVTRVVAR
jgi:DMSO/TMAO reductase YedYZ molybdopterin-dependent catalytic subunit